MPRLGHSGDTVFGCPEADGHCLLVSATTGSKPMPTAAVPSKPTVLSLAAELAAGRTSSRALIEAALARIADPAGEGARSFVKIYADSARAAADAQDALRKAGYVASPLAGLPVSIKDLFDVAGDITRAGSMALDDMPAAERDAPVIARLRAAGAVLIGRTNMTEFAFSGVGINPHYGTPGNPYDRRLIPGGSSSGAAVSVGDAQAIVGIGSDTGGSVRIPAALCGIVGFKPTQRRIPRDGVLPLSTTLDSIGPLANSVACCAIADAVMAGEPPEAPAPVRVAGMRLGVPQTYVLDGLAPEVASAFADACTRLSRAGAQIADLPLAELGEMPAINAGGGFAPIEAYAWHKKLIERRGDAYDQRVRTRIERAAGMSAVDYINLCAARADLIARVDARTAAFDALLMPTVTMSAPQIAAFARDDDYRHLNAAILRNPSVINFLDRCAITLPIQPPGTPPVGLMVVGEHGADRRLLGLARGIEAALAARE
jgi:aspartyl-tRNA(Asn)/glutamyl-tRNA(Gln) amidotransferase subunit A